MDEEARYSSVLLNENNSKSPNQHNRKSQELKKGNNKGQRINGPSNPPGISPTWSQVAKVFIFFNLAIEID